METLSYWLARLEPVIRAENEGEIIVVLANRCGTEDEAVYAGTSAVLGIQSGEVKVYGILGRGEKELLVVDTNKRPQAKLVSTAGSAENTGSDAPTEDSTFSRNSDASGLTVDTDSTSPMMPDAGVLSVEEGIVMPLSPTDPISPNAYFATEQPEPETLLESLKSSIAAPTYTPPLPSSPTFKRPESPKSRNASRSRQPSDQQSPALISHDLAMEEQVTQRAVRVRSPPHSATAIPDLQYSHFSNGVFGDRTDLPNRRPKSAMW